MKRLRTLVRDERGVALVMALTILLTLTGLVLAFLSVSAFEPQISRNHTDAVRARFVADSGIEYAYDQLVTLMASANPNPWDPALVGATCTTGAILGTANSTLPGLTSAAGTFTVRVRNDCKANDNKFTGAAVESAANATTDTNNKLIVTSVGTIGNTTRTITVVVSKANFPPIDGALSFPGLQSDVNFAGSAFDIDGRDHRMSDAPGSPTGPANAVLGISVANGAMETTVEAAVANYQNNDVRGKHQNTPNTVTSGAMTIAVPPVGPNQQTAQKITDFVNAVKGYADISIVSSPSNPYSITGIGSTCSTNVNDSACWGTTAKPKIVYIRGDLPGASDQMTSLSVSGISQGTGILIVENGNVDISGDFRWNGPIIITGNNVGIRYQGGGNQSVYGTTIVSELTPFDPSLEGAVSGNGKLLYSNEALTLVRNLLLRRLVRTQSWTDQ